MKRDQGDRMSENATRSIGQERVARMRDSLSRVVGPLKDDVEEIQQEIDRIQDEIDAYRKSRMEEISELRTARSEAIKLIRIAEPDFAKDSKPGPRRPRTWLVSDQATDEVFDFLRNHRDEYPNGFAVVQLIRHDGLTQSKETIRRAIERLADEGRLRLDRVDYVDGQHTGIRPKIFKLTEVG